MLCWFQLNLVTFLHTSGLFAVWRRKHRTDRAAGATPENLAALARQDVEDLRHLAADVAGPEDLEDGETQAPVEGVLEDVQGKVAVGGIVDVCGLHLGDAGALAQKLPGDVSGGRLVCLRPGQERLRINVPAPHAEVTASRRVHKAFMLHGRPLLLTGTVGCADVSCPRHAAGTSCLRYQLPVRNRVRRLRGTVISTTTTSARIAPCLRMVCRMAPWIWLVVCIQVAWILASGTGHP